MFSNSDYFFQGSIIYYGYKTFWTLLASGIWTLQIPDGKWWAWICKMRPKEREP
jgi:hypothetical protein